MLPGIVPSSPIAPRAVTVMYSQQGFTTGRAAKAAAGPAVATPFAALHNDPVAPVIPGVASIPATAEAGAARWRETRGGCRLGVMTRRFSRSYLQA